MFPSLLRRTNRVNASVKSLNKHLLPLKQRRPNITSINRYNNSYDTKSTIDTLKAFSKSTIYNYSVSENTMNNTEITKKLKAIEATIATMATNVKSIDNKNVVESLKSVGSLETKLENANKLMDESNKINEKYIGMFIVAIGVILANMGGFLTFMGYLWLGVGSYLYGGLLVPILVIIMATLLVCCIQVSGFKTATDGRLVKPYECMESVLNDLIEPFRNFEITIARPSSGNKH